MSMEVGRLKEALKQWTIWVVLSLLLVGLDGLGALGWFRAVSERVLFGMSEVVGGGVRLANRPAEAVEFWFTGVERIADLERRLEVAIVNRGELEELRAENESLRNLEGVFKKEDVRQVVMGKVLLGEVARMEGEVLVNLGEGAGIKENMMVVDSNKVLLGRVARVGRFSSVVETPKSNKVKIAVGVVDRTAKGFLMGDGSECGVVASFTSRNLGSR